MRLPVVEKDAGDGLPSFWEQLTVITAGGGEGSGVGVLCAGGGVGATPGGRPQTFRCEPDTQYTRPCDTATPLLLLPRCRA